MELHIKGHQTIVGLLKDRYREFDVVLYTNSDFEAPPFILTHSKDCIHIAIDDVEFSRKMQVAPSLDSVKKALDWTQGKDKLICCCHAGVSRSSATAYLIAAREWGAKAALSVLNPHRHSPNSLIVYLGSKILNDPSVWDTFVEWSKDETGLDHSKKDYSSHLKC